MSKYKITGLTAIVPIHNEEMAVKKVLEDLKACLSQSEIDWEIIAVNDGSTDNSQERLETIDGIKILNHAVNRGYSASLKTGIKEARYEWILIIDADGTYPVSAIPDFLAYAGDYDMVSGYRTGRHHDARWFGLQKLGKLILRRLVSYVAGQKIKDINCGLRIFNKKASLEFWHLYPERFSFTTTSLTAFLSHGYTVKFLPIDYHPRQGKSGIRPLRDFYNFISLILKIALFFRPLKVFAPISFILFLIALIVAVYSTVFLPKLLDTSVVLLFVSSLQTLFFGLLAALIVRGQNN